MTEQDNRTDISIDPNIIYKLEYAFDRAFENTKYWMDESESIVDQVKRPKLEPWRRGAKHRIYQHQVRAAPNGFRC